MEAKDTRYYIDVRRNKMLQSFNEIMGYVELHIEGDLKVDDLAKKPACPPFI